MQLAKELYTWRDYHAWDTGNDRYELIDGEYTLTPSPSFWHQKSLSNLGFLLGQYLRQHPVGDVVQAPMDVILADRTVVQPDLLVVLKANVRVEIRDEGIFGPPDLCVEVLSKSNTSHDRHTKREFYDRYGVSEYWMVDMDKRTVEVHRRADDKSPLRFAAIYEAGDLLTTPLLPGLTLPVAEVFPR